MHNIKKYQYAGNLGYQPNLSINPALEARFSTKEYPWLLTGGGTNNSSFLPATQFSFNTDTSGLKSLKIETPTIDNTAKKSWLNGALGSDLAQIGAGYVANWLGRNDSGTDDQQLANTIGTAASTIFGSNPYAMLGQAISNKITKRADYGNYGLSSPQLAGTLFAVNPWLGVGYIGASTINNLTGKTTQKSTTRDFMSDENLGQMWGSYNNARKKDDWSLAHEGKKYGGLGRLFGQYDKAQDRIAENEIRRKKMLYMWDDFQTGRARANIDKQSLDYQLALNGGLTQNGALRVGDGAKIPSIQDIDRIRKILKKCPKKQSKLIVSKKDFEDVTEFKEGGSIIPEGALHARKNHMEGAGKDYTHKGIPVMDKDGHQQAEIERNEIIFSLEVTKKLEMYASQGTEEAALKAGKLLVNEIFHNTEDRTGLIKEVAGLKQGGTLKFSKEDFKENTLEFDESDFEEPAGIEEVEYYQKGGTLEEFEQGNKIHQHFTYKPKPKPKYEDWVKDVNPQYLSDNYDIKTAYEVLPLEQLERWKFGVNSNEPEYYMDYQDDKGIYIYHLPSIAELDNGDFIFLKKGTESTNPELHFETDLYHNGENGFKDTHDLVYEGDRYYYRKKKISKKEIGGNITNSENIIEQISKLSPDKLQELSNILKYLQQ